MADEKYGNKDCAMYRDMFELLGRSDIDAVLIATGDHWHVPASILAAKAGKDIYSEKPCGITIALCQALDDTIRRYGRVFQAGTQRRSIANFQAAIHLAQSGKLGKLKTLHASIYNLRVRHDWLPAEPEPPRDVVDWDRWLGPSPWRPYNHAYVDGDWRGHYDFDSGATLHDWGADTVDLCQAANQADETTPVEYEARGGSVYARYSNGVKLVMRPDGWLGLGTCPVRFEGEEGWIETGDSGKIEVHPASLRSELHLFGTRVGTSPEQNVRNFLDCVKSGALPYSHSVRCGTRTLPAMRRRWPGNWTGSSPSIPSRRPLSATRRPTTFAAAQCVSRGMSDTLIVVADLRPSRAEPKPPSPLPPSHPQSENSL